jgi:hypothetical protein
MTAILILIYLAVSFGAALFMGRFIYEGGRPDVRR